ncbi:MAG: tRNA 4-thiouridine(8) synthase ThiI [Candidatus Acetothermia bacterium]|jgi:thiamine biosynthesis protein ThiI|nr:tRNA 4-thiouridine(8) synthase ThiI [Candidatus Acetothermia bacterium]MDH7505002.1 tRNA uracil 4-sulfurtransferase ThiI [Candidatus Acetothermia bacterium]
MPVYVVHYSEIALKGKNRAYFEEALARNIALMLKGHGEVKVRKRYGRLLVEGEGALDREALQLIPGIKSFAQAERVELDLEAIATMALRLAQGEQANSFMIRTKRSDKSFPLTSLEVNRLVGERVARQTGKTVSLTAPELTIHIEICSDEAYLYKEIVPGLGGLPVGTSGRVIALVSGGIDSPVAAFLMMKRGCEVILLHFFNETIHSLKVGGKLASLAERLAHFQGETKLYMVPFGGLQREIIKAVPARYRMLIYRRTMMRLAEEVARLEGAKALVTGDSLAQVASQTLDNLRVIYEATGLPVLAPLIGSDKEETIALARKIGTYEISILPYEDCCSFMVAPHPETHGDPQTIAALQKGLALDLADAISRAEIESFGPNRA